MRTRRFRTQRRAFVFFFVGAAIVAISAWWPSHLLEASESSLAFSIGKKKVTLDELYQESPASFYELEKQRYDLVERLAREAYLETFWADQAKAQGTSVEAAREAYLKKHADAPESEIKETLERFKDHPKLKSLSEAERRAQIVEYLTTLHTRTAIDEIVDEALRSKKLVIAYPKPSEPIYKVAVTQKDVVRYGPGLMDTKPAGCEEDCPITVVEYSEFQCPFCSRFQESATKLLEAYKGKVRWIVRDFPLSFHDRARPAAVAAHCAKEQGKFWPMYKTLFENQRALQDKDLFAYAGKVGLDAAKFKECFRNAGPMIARIDANISSGEKLGVAGTPTFFVNGRRLASALPFEEFKRIFDEELAKRDKNDKS